MSAVECRDLFKVHATPEGDAAALQGLSLSVVAGEMLAVLGPSGSGKSTLLRIVAGLERASAGGAVVLGHDMGRLSARRAADVRRTAVGLVDQHAERVLAPALSVAASVALALRLRGERRRPAEARAAGLLERASLGGLGDRLPRELSGGERQRAALCVAVAHAPAVVLADEPTGELDAAAARDVLDVLAGLAAEGATVLLVTHDPEAAGRADRVVLVRDGRVSDEGSGAERAVVISRGWLRVPGQFLDAAGIGDRARVRVTADGVLLQPAGAMAAPPEPAVPPAAAQAAPAARIAGVPAELAAATKAYGERAVLDAISARFEPATMTAISGRSGSGKSTLLRLLAGLERPDAGEVVVGGASLTGRDREWLADLRRRSVAVLDQDPALAGFLPAQDHVALPLTLAGASDREARERAAEWLAALGLAERARQPVGRLAAGERQRVALARALASGRGLLLVDEPTSRLDAANAASLAELLHRAAHDHGATVVCATHDPIVRDTADAVLSLDPATHALAPER